MGGSSLSQQARAFDPMAEVFRLLVSRKHWMAMLAGTIADWCPEWGGINDDALDAAEAAIKIELDAFSAAQLKSIRPKEAQPGAGEGDDKKSRIDKLTSFILETFAERTASAAPLYCPAWRAGSRCSTRT